MKHNREWKQTTKKWVSKHRHADGKSYCPIHYVQNVIEYSNEKYPTEKSAQEDLKKYNA
jgi:hypothetical protein